MFNLDISSKKDRKKMIRSIFEGVVLFILLIVILRALFSFQEYQPYKTETAENTENGFIAISYFGVDREGDDTLISTDRLEEHLKALYDQGYVTITQQDVLDYYEKGKPLPEKALYLMFEDGRRDTAIFAQKIMEKYNFKATMMSYVERFDDNQSKFLGLEDLKNLEDSTFWELGTNGYRLSYINVFDKEENYLGELTSVEFNTISDRLGRDYNHYLMDYIRDEEGVPKESRKEMEHRISRDYEDLERIYEEGLGYVPKTYVLMHSNTGAFGNNEKVSAVNEKWIKSLFAMNFNREGDCRNLDGSSIYDLTRMQPQSYWYTNHLLMRIADDTGLAMDFVEGEAEKLSDWEIQKGAAEYQKEKLILTSEAKDKGRVRLKGSEGYRDFYLHTKLTGNKVGEQKIYFRADEALGNYVAAAVKDNSLIITERVNGKEKELFRLDLGEFDGSKTEEELDIRESGNREIELLADGNTLTITVDKKPAVENLALTCTEKGGIYFESGWSDYGWSQRNIADDVYDGVFEELYIASAANQKDILYDGRYTGAKKVAYNLEKTWNRVVNWFIKYL